MKRKTYNRFVIVLFCGFILFFLLLSFFLPDKSFSQRENRYLQTLPKFSFRSLLKGEYTSAFEDYCADQFPFRDEWITLNARYEKLCGKKQTNGVYLCGNRLITPFDEPEKNELDRRCTAVKQFKDSVDIPVTFALIPTASEIYSSLLPQGAPNGSQTAVIEAIGQNGLVSAPLLTVLEQHREEDIFYRTDHHWTSLGAYYAYTALSESMGFIPESLNSFKPETVSDNFYGTAYSSSGYTWIEPDHIERFVDADAAASVVTYRSGAPAEGSLYIEDNLLQKDQYTYFLGGNTPELILTGRNSALPKLVIVRDSYSDSLAPFLLAHFSEIRMIDLRYYLGSVKDYALENSADHVLVIYSVENFCKENSVAAITG